MRRSLRPEVPSVFGGHPRACVNRRQSRSRSRVFPRRFGPRRPFTHGSQSLALALPEGYRRLDPRPCPSPRIALFTRYADRHFSGSGCRPTTSATDLPTHGHTPEHPIFAFRPSRVFAVTPNLRSPSPCLFRARRPSPLEEGSRTLRTATALPKPARRRCKHAAKRDPESHPPIETPLAGDASIRPPFAAMAVGRQRWTARAE
jgi:hypothetical protein